MAEGNKKSRFFTFQSIIPLIKQEKRLASLWLVALLGSSSATLMIPAAMKQLIDKGFSSTSNVNQVFLGLFLVALFLAFTTALRFFFVSLLAERIVLRLREKLYTHLIMLDIAFHNKNQSSELVSRLSADTELIRSVIASSMSVALRSFITFLGSLVLMLITEPKLALMTLLSIPLAVFPIIVGARLIRKKSRQNQDEVALANQHAAETLSAIYTVQAFAQESTSKTQFIAALRNTFFAAKQRIFSQSLVTLAAITLIFGTIVWVLWLGANDVINGRLTAGSLGQFVMYALLVGTSVGSLSEMFNEIQKASGGLQRISELLATQPSLKNEGKIDKLVNNKDYFISLKNISFAYPMYPDKYVLKEISLDIKPGETIAIVGPSGAGKSSLFHLLLRFYDPNEGEILFGEHSLKQWDLNALRQLIAIVPQKSDLFATSVKDNISYGKPGATMNDIEEVARAAEAYDFIVALPNGFDTFIGEKGTLLSGGQQQRLAIARAMLKNAPLLLLDEATSALDAQSEHSVQQGLERLMQGKTTIVIAHRLSTVLKADRIIVLDKGRIVEIGNHATLLAQNGLYAKLAKLQLN